MAPASEQVPPLTLRRRRFFFEGRRGSVGRRGFRFVGLNSRDRASLGFGLEVAPTPQPKSWNVVAVCPIKGFFLERRDRMSRFIAAGFCCGVGLFAAASDFPCKRRGRGLVRLRLGWFRHGGTFRPFVGFGFQ